MIIAGIGGLFVIVGVVLALVRRSQQAKLQAIASTETSTVQELSSLASSVNNELQSIGQAGGTGFRQMAELKGVIRSDSPLTSEVANQPCVYYKMEVRREYEESQYDSEKGRHETRRTSETLSNNSQHVPFWLEDATGRILVQPAGAQIDAQKVVDRFEPAQAIGGTISFGAFSLAIGGGGAGRTLGYRFEESILPLDRAVYLLGEASTSSGSLAIQKPLDKGKRFIISVKSEEELMRSTGSAVMWLLAGAIGSGVVGVALVAAGMLGRL
ncbi:MAG: E3 ubiquitin ligase family protein [Chloroflexi bacterium]|nr:E3 ubiquitin ligase family protein [Chloroflexota bacterium]